MRLRFQTVQLASKYKSIALLKFIALLSVEIKSTIIKNVPLNLYIFQSFNDEKTREILKNATPEDIKNGLIEKTLRKIHPDIRSKLENGFLESCKSGPSAGMWRPR